MRWQQGRKSDNVVDRRGGGAPRRRAPMKSGLGGLVVIGVGLYLGVEPSTLMSLVASGGGTSSREAAPIDDAQSQFVAVVLGDTEDTWHPLFRGLGRTYQEPKLVLFRDAVESACGFQRSAVGPF